MTKVCYQDGGEKRADLPFGDRTVLHNDVLFVLPAAPEKKKERQSASTERHFQNYTEHLKRFCHPCVVFFHLKT